MAETVQIESVFSPCGHHFRSFIVRTNRRTVGVIDDGKKRLSNREIANAELQNLLRAGWRVAPVGCVLSRGGVS